MTQRDDSRPADTLERALGATASAVSVASLDAGGARGAGDADGPDSRGEAPTSPAQSLPLMPDSVRRGRRSAVLLGSAVALLGGTLPLVEALEAVVTATRPLPERLARTAAGNAGMFLISGLLLVVAALDEARRLGRLVQAGGAVVLCLALASLALGWTSWAQAAAFGLLGGALLLLDHESHRRPHPAEWLALLVGWLGGLALTAAMLRLSPEYRMIGGLMIELPTSVALVAMAVGLLCVRSNRGLAAIASSATSGGTLIRRLVPVTLTVPPLGVWILVELAPRMGLFDAKFGAALGVLLGGAVVAISTSKLAARLATHDSELLAHQNKVRRALADLAQALRERNRVQKDLERSNRDLDEFAYAASHDLRAPLRGISNLAHWVEEDLGTDLPASARKQLDLLRGRVNRMEALIDGILKYSRAGRVHEPPVEVDVEALVRESIELVAPPPGARVEIGPGMPRLLTERAQLQQVFLNLISNAIKHARRDDPVVRISVEEDGDMLRFEVADNGPGIPLQYQERVWGMFQTLSSRDQVEGTGIGLATVKKLVERRGGRVGISSEDGAGARFFFLWPRSRVA